MPSDHVVRDLRAFQSAIRAGVGLEDMVVVETPDAVRVARKDGAQGVDKTVVRLKIEQRTQAVEHRMVHRPWGSIDSIDNGSRFQVKRIAVKPGGRLSLQMSHHRAEHWIVVSGTGLVTEGDEIFLLSEDQSPYLFGVTHPLENPRKLPIEIIEVLSGRYLGEDDIVRFEDTYRQS